MNTRFKKFISLFDSNTIDAYLVTRDANIKYLTEFNASESWLLVTRKRSVYITDSRYELESKQGLKGISVLVYKKSIFDTFYDTCKSLKVKNIGIDSQHISLSLYQRLKKQLPKRMKLIVRNSMIEGIREIKEKKEIQQIRNCIRLNLKAIDYIKRVVKPGLTEREIFGKLERYVKSRKAGFSFDPIVACGRNSCFPHAQVTDRRIKKNDVVLIDMGIDIDGYKSDLTRMFFLGKIPPHIREVNDYVDQSQREAIKSIKPGIAAAEIDNTARNFLKKKKLAKYFGHSLGHGVGLDIHEAPWIANKSKSILKEGMIFTVEPAVYIPNKFGIRIEDMVLVTRNGCEILTR